MNASKRTRCNMILCDYMTYIRCTYHASLMIYEIEKGLFIGDKDGAAIHSDEFDCIVNVTREIPFSQTFLARPKHLDCRIAVLDIDAPSELLLMKQGCQQYCPVVKSVLESGGRVLVHCSQGVQRSATFIAAYFMMKYNDNADQAISRLPRFIKVLRNL